MDLTEAKTLALDIMAQHGLAGWSFSWDRAVKRYGQCRYSTQTLSFSAPLTAQREPADFRNTVLHEVAHALTPGAGHGPRWRRQFLALGGDGRRTSEGPSVEAPWTGVHDGCSITFPRHRRPSAASYCPRCYRKPARSSLPTFDALMGQVMGSGPDNSRALIRWVRTANLNLANAAESKD